MMTSSDGNIFRVTGPLCEEFTDHRWIPLTKACNAELWYFLWFAPEQTVEQKIETSVISDAIALILASLQWNMNKAEDALRNVSGHHHMIMQRLGLGVNIFRSLWNVTPIHMDFNGPFTYGASA